MLGMLGDLWSVATALVSFLVVLSVVVFVHEYGHYIVGRWCGIGAEAFSLGFGKELYGWTDRRGTRWKISALPLGGYVKFLGDADAASTVKDREAWAHLSADQKAHSFHDASVGRRALTVLAGPGANFLLSIAVFAAMALAIGAPSDEPVIGRLGEDVNAAFREAVSEGDRIAAVNGRPVSDFAAMTEALLDAEGRPVTLTIEDPEGGSRTVETAFRPPARVDGTTPEGPAASAGLRPGDVIVAVDGEPVGGFPGLQRAVEASGDAPLVLTVRRGGERFEAAVAPEMVETQDGTRPVIGIRKQLTELGPEQEGLGPIAALSYGVERTWGVVSLSLGGIWDVVSGAQAAEEVLGGPVRIAALSGQAAEAGGGTFIALIAVLSTSIGLINLFPIPVLDGGHLVFYAVEAAQGRPLRERWQELGNRIGFALVIALMLFATFNDIANL